MQTTAKVCHAVKSFIGGVSKLKAIAIVRSAEQYCFSTAYNWQNVVRNKLFFGDFMDNILRDFLELDVLESMCDDTKLFIYNWLKEKFTSYNKQSAPCKNVSCCKCDNGYCFKGWWNCDKRQWL